MSTGKRAYNLLRAYVGREWDRIKNWEKIDALRELDSPVAHDPGTRPAQEASPPDPDKTVIYVPEGTTHEEAARHVLGVDTGADFREVRHAFVKLSRRSDPSNFKKGSVDYRKSHDIYKKVHWAYRTLTADMSDSEKRFGSLEID